VLPIRTGRQHEVVFAFAEFLRPVSGELLGQLADGARVVTMVAVTRAASCRLW
jgi:hypothetical protein